jgi:hypothetical protein
VNIDSDDILLNNKIYDFFIFNNSGICILEKQFDSILKDTEKYMNYKLLIKNIAHNLLINSENTKFPKDESEVLNIANDKIIKENKFIFKSIKLEKCKILFLIRNNNIFVGVFYSNSSIEFQRLLLMHIFIALINYEEDSFNIMNILNDCEQYDFHTFTTLKSFHNKNINLSEENNYRISKLLLFEHYFLKIIIVHFYKVFNEMFKKEFLNLNQTRFKNMYILDIETSSLILDMRKIQGDKENRQRKYIKNKKLLEEIIYQSKHMYNTYIEENRLKFTSTDSIYRFVKLECSSTYPRLMFIIKFIPVLKGIAIIHIYYQKKLSRHLESNPLEQELRYKEIDLLFGSDIKDNQNLEFKYGAPKKLQKIEKFFEEFFVSDKTGFDIFRINNKKKFKYFNYPIINIINKVVVSNNDEIERIYTDVNEKLEEEYNKDQESKNENIKDEENSTDDEFILHKDSFYNEILEVKNRDNTNSRMNSKIKIRKKLIDTSSNQSLTLEFDKENETNKSIKINKNKKDNSNINIEKYFESEAITERNDLLQKNKNKSKNKIDNISLISKDISNFNISNAKEIKITDLLDMTNIKKKNIKNSPEFGNNTYKNENKLTIKNTDSKDLILNSINDDKS